MKIRIFLVSLSCVCLFCFLGCEKFIMNNELYNKQEDEDSEYITLPAINVMVQKSDLSSSIDWRGANELCKVSRVGGFNDWRLPTIAELSVLYDKRGTIGGFNSNSGYWSCEYSVDYYDYVFFYYNFYNRRIEFADMEDQNSVRAVRTLSEEH